MSTYNLATSHICRL